MRRKGIVVVVCALLMFFAGCGFLSQVTEEKPLGPVDPNAVAKWVELGQHIGEDAKAVGIVLGKPEIVGLGVLIALSAGLVGKSLKEKK